MTGRCRTAGWNSSNVNLMREPTFPDLYTPYSLY